jgi:NYN domain
VISPTRAPAVHNAVPIGARDATAAEPPVHLFVDLSNIFLGARQMATTLHEYPPALRLSAEHLHRVMAAGRPVASATLVANAMVPEAALRHFRPWFRVLRAETGRQTGTEQSADQLLQNAIFLELLQPSEPGIVVLATGDGAGWRDGRGFIPTLIAARRRGFAVEVVSFAASLNPALRDLADATGMLVELDDYYFAVTFLEGLRWPQPILLRHRATAHPSPWRMDAGFIEAAQRAARRGTEGPE